MSRGQNTPTSNSGRLTQRITAASTNQINSWQSDVPTLVEGYMKNGIVETYSNDPDRVFVTHRPNINIDVPVSGGGGTKGRGVYWWSAISQKYFMNDNVIYKGTYAAPCSLYGGDTAIASGSKKVYFAEWSSANEDYLFILDPEGGGIYAIAASASTTVINILDRGSGTGAPFHASDTWDFADLVAAIGTDGGLANGLVTLDTYLFVGMSNGNIYNSGVDDWLTWNALGKATTERSPDMLYYLAKQKDHIVAISGATIEILYNNANEAPASPLSTRTDVAYRTGAAFPEAVWENGDTTWFMGLDAGGDMTLYDITDFRLTPHVNPSMQMYLWMIRYIDDLDFTMHGISLGSHTYVVLTVLNAGTGVISICYDASTDIWGEWSTTCNSNTMFQLIGYMRRAADNDNRPMGMLRSGDLFYMGTGRVPTDLVNGGSDVNVPLSITTGPFDAGTSETKFMHSCNYVGNQLASAGTLTVEWSDDDGANWLSQTIDLSNRTQINRLGDFVSRRFRFSISDTQYMRFEAIDVTFSQGDN